MRGSKMSRAILAGSISIFRADNLYQPCNGGDHHFNQHFYLNCPKNTYNSQPSAFSTNHLSSTIPNQNHPTPTKKKSPHQTPPIVLQSHRVVPKDVEVEPQLFRPALLSPATHVGYRCTAKVLQQLDGL